MIVVVAVALVVVVLWFTLGVRAKDLPEPEPVSPIKHLEDKKARIYESLRDLNFEFRVGKLSDTDYQRTKTELQKELAGVLADIDKAAPAPAPASNTKQDPLVCPHCKARFDKPMKFCGQCGKAMETRS
ncbi:MAG: zinc ribbon domain-containing protein [Acidobacteria bacterium]|nr:zinc ribbon domain-containing protein [Acidobacteriota bacterium]